MRLLRLLKILLGASNQEAQPAKSSDVTLHKSIPSLSLININLK